MADLNNIDEVANATPNAAAENAPVAKKTRKPRTPKIAPEKVAGADAITSESPVKKTRAKRGSKAGAEAASKPTSRKAVQKAPRAAIGTSVATSAHAPLDDIASLMQLEEENKKLRKQLFDKLHAENADLRKRLGQN
jgi:hypothetical protein